MHGFSFDMVIGPGLFFSLLEHGGVMMMTTVVAVVVACTCFFHEMSPKNKKMGSILVAKTTK